MHDLIYSRYHDLLMRGVSESSSLFSLPPRLPPTSCRRNRLPSQLTSSPAATPPAGEDSRVASSWIHELVVPIPVFLVIRTNNNWD
ncbi:hypothetical protein ZWY2020_052441 [Hordeum vulgare]|nr:hypothetical protein ZWY2020_052441 [Hordeum vulgare]